MDNIINDVPKEKANILKKLWTHRKTFNMEVFMYLYILPGLLSSVAVQNFPLEKACRANYNYSDTVCQALFNKDDFGINCTRFNFENVTHIGSGPLWNVTNLSSNFNYTVCKAERDVQKLSAHVSGIRAPMAAIFPLIVVLFAGGWSDRYNKRKPFILFPLIGDILSSPIQLICAIFFDAIPMEFGAYTDAIISSMFGGFSFVLIAVYGYMTAATPEADRVFRFGVFALCVNFMGIIGPLFSGVLFKKLGYVNSFAMCWMFQMLAFLYVFFFVEEAKTTSKKDIPNEDDVQNKVFEITELSKVNRNKKVIAAHVETISADQDLSRKKSCLAEFFDPTLAIGCLKLPLQKRPNYGKPLLIALIFGYLFTIGPGAENEYVFKFVTSKLNWNGNQYSVYNTISTAVSMLGTFIGTAILSKILKMSDPMIGILSGLLMVVSRPMFAFARDSIMFYVGAVFEMFISLRVIAIKTIGSSLVDGDELSRLFALFGVSEQIAQFIFPPLYSYVYISVFDSFSGAIFLFSEFFYIPDVIIFIICYILMKKKLKKDGETNQVDEDKKNENEDPEIEITKL